MRDGAGAAVAVEELEKRYGDVRALDGISFSTARGEVFGLLGHNGAGKSTTIRILTGRARPSAGHAEVLGHPVPDELEEIRADINLVAETPTVYERATAKENLDLFCKLYSLPTARGDEALERVDLAFAAKRKVKTFSTGMRQRLLLARAVLNEPRVLFLDEPTRGLDPQSAREVHALVRELADGGATIFLTTHDMTEADGLCDRVAFLADGRIAALDTPRALKLRLGGTPAVDVVVDDGSELRLRLDRDADASRLHELVGAGRVRTVHSREATLADVFIATAGRSLDDGDDTDGGGGER
jgi:ABC-2 type transport system ATP-binding protein